MAVMTELSFISLLFEYRRIFHQIAARDITPGNAPPIVVCWVDVILAKLAEVIVVFAHGPSEDVKRPPLTTLQRQMEGDALRAATQLPDRWSSVVNVLSSENSSPAASRIALRLFFAVHVIGKQLRELMMSGYENELDRTNTIRIRQACITRIAMPTRAFERINYAMLLSLIATMDLFQEDEPFRPHTDATLLRYVQLVMCNNLPTTSAELIIPIELLDVPQTIFIRWGCTVPWCWSKWDDPRIAHSEIVDYTTVNWLYPISSPYTSTLLTTPTPRLQSPILKVVLNGCWAASQLLQISGTHNHSASLELWSVYSDVESSARDFVVEALTYACPEMLRKTVQALLDDRKLDFVLKLEESDPIRDDAQRMPLQDQDIMWHGDTNRSLINWDVPSFMPSPSDSLFEAQNDEGLAASGKLWSEDVIWQKTLDSPSTDLFVASGFASYILATAPRNVCDVLTCAEAWSRLCDILLLIATHHFLDVEEPLALLVCPSILQALSCLVQHANAVAVQFMISSPWTMSLCARLKDLLDHPPADESSYEFMFIMRHLSLPSSKSRLIFCRIDSVPRLLLVHTA
ncbi:hypothetical protein B0H21DRAFT_741825 [Amylocystis lapponica]|nr:hypothetical protein B0H21DRAFT_741825 [Amylocystis lapponica]